MKVSPSEPTQHGDTWSRTSLAAPLGGVPGHAGAPQAHRRSTCGVVSKRERGNYASGSSVPRGSDPPGSNEAGTRSGPSNLKRGIISQKSGAYPGRFLDFPFLSNMRRFQISLPDLTSAGTCRE